MSKKYLPVLIFEFAIAIISMVTVIVITFSDDSTSRIVGLILLVIGIVSILCSGWLARQQFRQSRILPSILRKPADFFGEDGLRLHHFGIGTIFSVAGLVEIVLSYLGR